MKLKVILEPSEEGIYGYGTIASRLYIGRRIEGEGYTEYSRGNRIVFGTGGR